MTQGMDWSILKEIRLREWFIAFIGALAMVFIPLLGYASNGRANSLGSSASGAVMALTVAMALFLKERRTNTTIGLTKLQRLCAILIGAMAIVDLVSLLFLLIP